MDNAVRTSEFLREQRDRASELRNTLEMLLAQRKSVTLEIGAGHGHFLAAYAATHAEEFCIGIDLVADRVRRGARKAERARLSNAVFLQAEATAFLQALPGHVSLKRIFILFPDPWPKRRHHKNRIIRPEFMTALAARAGTGAQLYFRTDYAPYFSAAQAVINAHDDWQLTEAPWAFESETVFQSRAATYRSLVAQRHAVPTSPDENIADRSAAQPTRESPPNAKHATGLDPVNFPGLTWSEPLRTSDSFLTISRRADHPTTE